MNNIIVFLLFNLVSMKTKTLSLIISLVLSIGNENT